MALSWNDLSDREKQDLVRQYNSDRHSIDFDRYNATQEGLWSQIRRYRYALTNSPATYTPIDTAIDDTRRWNQTLQNLTNKHRFIQVSHFADVHFPFQDDNALELAYKLVEHIQPHIIVVGSDTFDFHLLSSFGIDPDYDDNEDELVRIEELWNPHINQLNKIAPNSEIVWIFGNHEARLLRYVLKNAPNLRKTVMSKFQDIIRNNGRVQYLGEIDRVMIGDVLVQHGTRVGKYAARALLDDIGYQTHTMGAHTHHLTYFEKPGILKTTKAITSGCLCQKNPHYVRVTELRNRWQLGTSFADIDTTGESTDFINLEFNRGIGDGLETRIGFTTITSENPLNWRGKTKGLAQKTVPEVS